MHLAWLVLGAVVAVPALLVLWLVCRVCIKFVAYQLNKNKFAHLPQGPALLPYFAKPDGFESILKVLPRDETGGYLPLFKSGFFMDGAHMVVVTNPEAFKAILTNTTDFPKYPPQYDAARLFFGSEQMGNLSGEKHRIQRHVITPVFHFERLKALGPIFVRHARQTMKTLHSAAAQSTPVALLPVLSRLTLRVLIAAAFGDAFDVDWMSERWTRMAELFSKHMFTQILLGDVVERVPWLFPATSKLASMRREIYARVVEFVKRREAEFTATAPTERKDKDLLSALLTACHEAEPDQRLSTDALIDNCLLFLGAGQETVASTLQWFLYFMVMYPDAQQKLHEEIDRVMGPVTASSAKDAEESSSSSEADEHFAKVALEELPYMRACFEETLRLRPAVPATSRLVTRDLELNGHFLPKDTCVLILFYGLHHNPKLWDEPMMFRPERFLKDNAARTSRHPFAYLPFSAATHSCIGMNFAKKEALIVLLSIFRQFRAQLACGPDDTKGVVRAALGPANLRVRFELRNGGQ